MAIVEFTPHLQMHLECEPQTVDGRTLAEALHNVFEVNPKLCGYVMDDQGAVRKHVAIFVDGKLLRDRSNLDIPLTDKTKVFVMQALSGG